MNKIIESLSKLLPESDVKEVAEVINSMLEEAKTSLEEEYNSKLEEAYAELSEELAKNEKIAEEGYSEAYVIINDLRNRLEVQGEEYRQAIEEGYGEAYDVLKSTLQEEQEKNRKLEISLHEEYDQKVQEVQETIINQVHDFLKHKGQEIYEQAKKELTNDPRIAESRVVLDKIVNNVSEYLTEDGVNAVSVSKLEEANKSIEEMKGQIKLLEARNIRLSTDNTKLTESVRQAKDIINESKKAVVKDKKAEVVSEQKERIEKSEEVLGRGLVTESVNKKDVVVETTTSKNSDYEKMLILSGLKKS